MIHPADWVRSGRDVLIEECVRALQQILRGAPSHKKEIGGRETVMLILRMRPNTSDFSTTIADPGVGLVTMQAEQEQRKRQKQKRMAQRTGGAACVPKVPAMPEIHP